MYPAIRKYKFQTEIQIDLSLKIRTSSIRYLDLRNTGTHLIENEDTVSVRTIWGDGGRG